MLSLHIVILIFSSLLVYAQVPTPCSVNGLANSYDVIVVGGGLGGSVAARRIAEANPDWKVLVIERGIPYESCQTCQLSSTTSLIYVTTESGGYLTTAPQKQLGNASIIFKDPSVQGGGTAVNGEAHIRGDAFRYFPDNYPLNWNYPTMLYYYQKYENYTYPAGFHGSEPYSNAANLRGTKGPVTASQQPQRPFTIKFLNAMKQIYSTMPVYYNRSLNDGPFPGIGAAPPEVTSIGNVRVSAYTAYIRSYTGTNLKSITNTLVAKVLFNGTAVSGVSIGFNIPSLLQPLTSFCTVRTKRVVMSSGTIGTVKTLKLSGVGPAAELTRLGIPVVANVPKLGQNYNDHFVLFSTYSGYTDDAVNGNFPDQIAYAFFNAANQGPSAPNDFAYNLAKSPMKGFIALSTSRTNADSRGTVTLRSSDPRAAPVVDPNYFAVQSEKNASALAIFKLRQAAALLNLVPIDDPCLGRRCDTPANTFDSYIAAGAFTVAYHFTSTAALCEVTNPVSLRVQGTSGLYVLDASIMPKSPAANTQSTLYAVAEYGAQLINLNMRLDSGGAAIAEAIGEGFCLLENL